MRSIKDKYTRDMCWTRICRQLYPDFDGYTSALQQKISHDVKQRWRSVRDQFQKIQTKIGKSGSSPSKIHCSLYDDLSFLLTSRTLRSTDGNISPPEDASQEPAGSTDSMDGSSLCGPDSPSTSVVASSASSSGTASSSEPQNTPAPNTKRVANPVSLTEPQPKKSKPPQKIEETTKRVNDTIDLINKSSREDY